MISIVRAYRVLDPEVMAADEAARQPISKSLPDPLRIWWEWAEEGMAAWRNDVWAIIGWLLAIVALVLISPLYIVGQVCRYLREMC